MSVLLYGSSFAQPGTYERAIHDSFIPWVIRRIPHMARVGAPGFGPCAVFVVASSADPKARILAVVVFHNFHSAYRMVEVSMASASPMWARPSIVTALLSYVFNTAKCERLQAVIPKRGSMAKHVNRFLTKSLGFKFEGIGRRALGNDDAVMLSMLREDASRWLGAPLQIEGRAA